MWNDVGYEMAGDIDAQHFVGTRKHLYVVMSSSAYGFYVCPHKGSAKISPPTANTQASKKGKRNNENEI